MMEVDEISAFNAFQNQLRTLCLTEFPCGVGSWRGTDTKESRGKLLDAVETHFSVTHKDYGAHNEKTETLEEFVKDKRSPWNLDYSWSSEARKLREIAVKSPWLIDDVFILSHFKTLKIVDKQVTDVDERLLEFTNLEELTLSTNCIQALNSKNLPRSLKVLELCANQISDLFSLCVKPPLLEHLGLAYNQIEFIDDYITGDYWPELLSLDLSRNNLSDLMEVVRKLATLPRLRNLVLQGNPLSLVPGYRGYTVDSLKGLSYLDDVGITADERHHFKGLAKKKEYILDEAKLVFKVAFLKNIPMPEELKFPEEQPDFPQITRNYYAQFKFLNDTTSKAEIFQITHDFTLDHIDQGMSETFSQSVRSEKGRSMQSSIVDDGLDVEKNVNFAVDLETVNHPETPMVVVEGTSADDVGLPAEKEGELDEKQDKEAAELIEIKSKKADWSEDMTLDWSMLVVRDNLLMLRDFFIQGMDVQVIEEKILGYPAEDFANPDGLSPAGSQRSGKGEKKDKKKDDKGKRSSNSRHRSSSQHRSASRSRSQPKTRSQSRSQSRGRQRKPADSPSRAYNASRQKSQMRQTSRSPRRASKGRSGSRGRSPQRSVSSFRKGDDKGKKDGKGKGKKKEPEIELREMPAEYTTLASFHIPLEDFLLGEHVFENVFVTAEPNASTPTPVPVSKIDEKGKKREKSAEKKDKKDRNKSPKGKEKDAKADKGNQAGKDSKKDQLQVENTGEEEELPPPPLELQVGIELLHWSTARDALNQQEENNEEATETSVG